jgi:hypothetical protein
VPVPILSPERNTKYGEKKPYIFISLFGITMKLQWGFLQVSFNSASILFLLLLLAGRHLIRKIVSLLLKTVNHIPFQFLFKALNGGKRKTHLVQKDLLFFVCLSFNRIFYHKNG